MIHFLYASIHATQLATDYFAAIAVVFVAEIGFSVSTSDQFLAAIGHSFAETRRSFAEIDCIVPTVAKFAVVIVAEIECSVAV